MHNKEKPFECKAKGCGEKFGKKRSLNIHINNVHNLHTNNNVDLKKKTSNVPISLVVKGEVQDPVEEKGEENYDTKEPEEVMLEEGPMGLTMGKEM